jgi:hypothetical protein
MVAIELLTDQSDSLFPEIRVMEQLCQAALRNDHNQHTVPTNESNLYLGSTAQLSLLDLENPLEELLHNMIQNNPDSSNTILYAIHQNISIYGENRFENVSTLSPTQRFFQL